MTDEVQELRGQCAILACNVNALAKAMSLLIARLQAVEAQTEAVAAIQRHMRALPPPGLGPNQTWCPPAGAFITPALPSLPNFTGTAVVPWKPYIPGQSGDPLPPLPSIS